MNLFRPLRGGALCALFLSAGLGLVGCLNPPEYPVVPSIEFSSVKNTYVPAAGVLVARNDPWNFSPRPSVTCNDP